MVTNLCSRFESLDVDVALTTDSDSSELQISDPKNVNGYCQFNFQNPNDWEVPKTKINSYKKLTVNKRSTNSISYYIKIIKTGPVSFTIQADFKVGGKSYSDKVERTLQVEPGSLRKYTKEKSFIKLLDQNQIIEQFEIQATRDDSKVEVSIDTNIFGATLNTSLSLM